MRLGPFLVIAILLLTLRGAGGFLMFHVASGFDPCAARAGRFCRFIFHLLPDAA